MKDTKKERQHERERAWNRPLSARSRTVSQSGSAGHSPRHELDQPRSSPSSASHSQEHSRAPSPSESVRSRTAEEGDENHKRERNWGSPRPKWDHQRRPPTPSLLGTSPLRPRTQSTHSNGPDTHAHAPAQNQRLRHVSSQSSLLSESSSRASSPDLQAGPSNEEEGAMHERERNWGSRQQKRSHIHVHKRAASPSPVVSKSRVPQIPESDLPALTRPTNGLLKGRPSELSLSAPPDAAEQDEIPMSVSSRFSKPANGHAHDKSSRWPSRLHRPDSPIDGNSAEVKGSPPASAPARFGWQFPRNRPQLPDFEPETSSREHSSSPVHPPTGRTGSGMPSHIPVRSPNQVPKVEIKRNGHVQAFTKGHRRTTTEFTEANGAIPPKIHFQPEPELGPELTSEHESTAAKSLQGLSLTFHESVLSCSIFSGSDESMQDVLTPIARPIEIPPAEKFRSFAPVGNSLAYAEAIPTADDRDSVPPAATPIDPARSFELSTPPRPSLSTSKVEFETPPSKGLPDLPGPPSSSEDETGNIDVMSTSRKGGEPVNGTVTKTPRLPGAWAATPAPARSQTPQPTSSSFTTAKLSRTRSNSLPQTSFTDGQPSTVPHPSALSRAGTLPVRTPAPPGGWFSTPGSLRRKNLMKVRFDTIPSDGASSDADAGVKDGKAAASLPVADWDEASQPRPSQDTSVSMSEPSFNHVETSSPATASSAVTSGHDEEADGAAANAPADTTEFTAAGSSPRRKTRRSPSVRLVDEYGRAQTDQPITPSRKDSKDHSISMRMPGGGPLKTPRSASVRIVDAMGREVEEPSEQNDSEDTVTEVRYSRQEALQRMKRAVADLQEGLKGVNT
jgi:serine/arginine repetitive matrix protein 2